GTECRPVPAADRPPLGQEAARAGVLPNTARRHVDVATRVRCQMLAKGGPLGQVGTRAGELLDALVSLVRDVDVTGAIRGHSDWIVELTRAAPPGRAPLRDVGAHAGELLDAVVSEIRDVHVAGGVRRHSVGIDEMPIAASVRAPL